MAWSGPLAGSPQTDPLHYCRIKRGASGCDNPVRTFPRGDASAGFTQVVAYGETLVILSQRRVDRRPGQVPAR